MKSAYLLMFLCVFLVKAQNNPEDPAVAEAPAEGSPIDSRYHQGCSLRDRCRDARGSCKRTCDRNSEDEITGGCDGRDCKCCAPTPTQRKCRSSKECRRAGGRCQTTQCGSHEREIRHGCSSTDSHRWLIDVAASGSIGIGGGIGAGVGGASGGTGGTSGGSGGSSSGTGGGSSSGSGGSSSGSGSSSGGSGSSSGGSGSSSGGSGSSSSGSSSSSKRVCYCCAPRGGNHYDIREGENDVGAAGAEEDAPQGADEVVEGGEEEELNVEEEGEEEEVEAEEEEEQQ
ncbi:golgin subfamily A member 6-like protein 2 [Procambarus clarkii]|uniref:golgin subfamily A member 6-like protein 2 n=1 Tax=Procambarus clarkii TaxID=6728 RepID=UPI001E677F20|nr:uncharacterized transmembrane protein DDB_G0289901-like [Procambarus clarkii]